jgi:hypothetical protein
MAETKREEWREIAEAIQHETDSAKVTELAKKLCEAFDAHQQVGNNNSPCNGNGDGTGNAA